MKQITVDGNTAAAKIAYAFSDMAAIYPITPSSPMAELADEWQGKDVKNIFGNTVKVTQLQSEAGAAGTVHGSLSAGALTTTFTCSQGLLLMIPNMYKIAGELLPCVFHVSARALSTHALSIFGDHSDVMACRSTGFAMLASSSVQEALDMATVAHIATLKSSVPFMHFFDGFRTSHEINKINDIDYEDLRKLAPTQYINAFRHRALSTVTPHQQGTAQNPDIYFQNREACNTYYNNAVVCVKDAMKELYKITGRKYSTFDYYGDKNAECVVILMGSGAQTAIETVKSLNKQGYKAGVVNVRLYRPFEPKDLIKALPKTTKVIAVLDRTKEAGSCGEALYQDVCCALSQQEVKDIKVIGGRYGIGGKEFTPNMVKAVIDNAISANPKNHFTVGIIDDVTELSLPLETYHLDDGNYSCKFYGLGSDGTVSANKNSIKIIGDNTDYNCQGYFEYDSKKSGSLTISHLRFGKGNTNAPYLISNADFIACHNISFVTKYDMARDLKDGGTFLLNSPYTQKELEKVLPEAFIATLKDKKAKLYIVDANKVAKACGLGNRINVIMQSCFFKLTNIIEYSVVEDLLIEAAKKTYKRKGEAIVNANVEAIVNATKNLFEVDLASIKTSANKSTSSVKDEYYTKYISKIEHKQGDDLKVSQFDARGFVPTDTAKYEKRGISEQAPCWIKENCIQCNMCSFVCPHAAIRPVLVSDKDLKKAPEGFETNKALGVDGYNFRMQVNVADCTGCQNCVAVCPAKNKALQMQPSTEQDKNQKQNYEFSTTITNPQTIFKPDTIKGSQFNKPYFEFSGACAGCGETPYIKLVSQLFGERLLIANATGCSSIYSGSAPTSPFAKNKDGRGPSWASSLFEDNAEFGYGIHLAKQTARNTLYNVVKENIENVLHPVLKSLLNEWLENFDNSQKCYELSLQIIPMLDVTSPMYAYKNSFVKETTWIIGGDGWAYDIGYGGLDHILASGENINVLVLDTEVYSNTGGQTSKSTPVGAVAKFASEGKRSPKKDLGMMAMSYKNVYVAQVGMGADMNQVVKAMAEAEAYNGPSLIIAYAPCINHGINMNASQAEIKKAVECGYWHLYRYNPDLTKQGKNPFTLDSPAPTRDYKEFLEGESRYATLKKLSESLAEKLYEESKAYAQARYQTYLKLSKGE